jgi:hypothetical protein
MYKKYVDGPQKKLRSDQTADPEVLEKFEADQNQAKL